jgi:hypothetical protein
LPSDSTPPPPPTPPQIQATYRQAHAVLYHMTVMPDFSQTEGVFSFLH